MIVGNKKLLQFGIKDDSVKIIDQTLYHLNLK